MENICFEYVSIDQIQPYEKNARKHGEVDIEAIKNSIQEFGFNDPIGIWHDTIVEGHGRLQAAKELGMTRVPVIRLDHMSDEQRKGYALAHNKTAELSEWDFDVLEEELAQIWNVDMSKLGFAQEVPETTDEIIEDDYSDPAPEDPKSVRGGCVPTRQARPHVRRQHVCRRRLHTDGIHRSRLLHNGSAIQC